MVSSEQVRADLREIRYYYSRKEQLEDASHSIGSLPIKRLLEKYNCVIREAPLRLYDLYACLYLRGQTQKAIALELGYTPQYIRKLINELFGILDKLYVRAHLRQLRSESGCHTEYKHFVREEELLEVAEREKQIAEALYDERTTNGKD